MIGTVRMRKEETRNVDRGVAAGIKSGYSICTSTNSMEAESGETKRSIHLNIPPRMYQIPLTAVGVGCAIGIMRGGRSASLRFLAENAHRPPKTVQGWYFYKKTKNYRVMWGALKGAARESSRLGGITGAYVLLEEGMNRAGYREWASVGAGTGTGLLFGALNGGIWKQAVVLGLVMGCSLKGLDMARDSMDP
ncbi:hypothetical protein NMY22_g13081 [Coprinellus aureogranulatus]|nr:hypothetical protein NMY22_g13081 [Coprinellus aureogranulatus]